MVVEELAIATRTRRHCHLLSLLGRAKTLRLKLGCTPKVTLKPISLAVVPFCLPSEHPGAKGCLMLKANLSPHSSHAADAFGLCALPMKSRHGRGTSIAS
jgi:hypothetical protein